MKKSVILPKLNKIAKTLKSDESNYSTVEGKITDLLCKGGYGSHDSGANFGQVCTSWEYWKHNKTGEKIKMVTRSGNRTTISAW